MKIHQLISHSYAVQSTETCRVQIDWNRSHPISCSASGGSQMVAAFQESFFRNVVMMTFSLSAVDICCRMSPYCRSLGIVWLKSAAQGVLCKGFTSGVAVTEWIAIFHIIAGCELHNQQAASSSIFAVHAVPLLYTMRVT